ncbi:MAG: hypothetical protein VKJ46_16195 [Leptolyngbyaceae bacterium]|nr:hypothetical protein [Leptolyngbyaceae bacterium]
MVTGIIIVICLAAVSIFIAVNLQLDRQRTEAIKQLANNLGFQYQPEPKSYIPSQIWQFRLFSQGRGRRFYNLIQGHRKGAKISISDYSYTSGHGKNTRTSTQTVVLVESDDLDLPSFELTPEDIFDKVGNILGFHDINFETHPDFSRHHNLAGSDESSIRQLFHDGVLNFYQTRTNVNTEGKGSIFIHHHNYKTLPPDQWEICIDEAFALYQYFTRKIF